MPQERLHLMKNMPKEEQDKLISQEPRPIIAVATHTGGRGGTKSLIYTLYQIMIKVKREHLALLTKGDILVISFPRLLNNFL